MVKAGYKQTEVGVIPEDWRVGAASEICELVVDCKNRTPPVIDGGEFAVVRTPNVRNGKFVRDELRFTDEQSYHEWTARAIPQIGDVLITREAPLGEVCLVPSDIQVCLGQRMMLYRPDLKKMKSSFLLYALMSSGVQKNLLKRIGGSTVGHARVDDIRDLQIPVPSNLVEQEAIAAVLSDVDALIAALDKLIAKKRAIKTGTMQQLLTGEKRLPGFGNGRGYKQTEIGRIPEDWQVATLDSLSSKGGLVRGPFGGALKKEFFVKHGYKVYEQRNAIYATTEAGTYFIDSEKYKELNRFKVNPGNFIVSCSGTIGRIFRIPNNAPEGIINQALLKIVLNPNVINSHFFLSLFRWVPFQEKIIDNSHGGAMQNLVGMDIFRNTLIQVPPMEEQHAIAEVLSDIDSEITALETRRAKTQAIKQGMMQELLTGRTRLNCDLND